MRTPGRIASSLAIAAALLAVTPSQAYYHYIHYLTGKAPFIPVPYAFDLKALPGKTVAFFVNDTGLTVYGPNDSFASVLSQVKQAAAAWNAVASSDLRLAFGGLESSNGNSISTTPGGDVVFQDLAPGILGMGAPEVADSATVQSGQNGQFFPISRGKVILTSTTDPNAPSGPGPSYLEEFYTTAVHEFGHALGLQHTWTGSAMSQDVIRNTSRARPVDADDVAAICELYGATGWMANVGSISGRVSANGAGWSMASVVAIPPVGPPVSSLTNPDGSYTINGLAPGQYMLYAHPLPQSAIQLNGQGLVLPRDARGLDFAPTTGYFQTVFYPGTIDLTQATTFTVAAGQAITGKDFAVQKRTAVPIYDVWTYSYLDPTSRTYSYNTDTSKPASLAVTPAYAGSDQLYLQVFATANNLAITPIPTAAALLGPGTGPGLISPYSPYKGYQDAAIYFPNRGGLTPGPRHLVMTFATSQGPDIYVLPDAVTVVRNGPPEIDSVTANSDRSVTLTGAGLTADSRVFFDGLQGTVTVPLAASATDAAIGVVTVMPPQGASGQTATVTVFTADNQNSMFLQGASPVTYPYPAADAPQIAAISPPALPAGFNSAGTAAMVDITTTNTNLVDGQVTLGFGTSDISVRRIWVLDPTHLVADVVVANNAAIGATSVNVISGFQMISKPAAFQIQPPNGNLPTPALPVYNAISYATVLHGADYASIFGANLAVTPNSSQVFLNGAAMTMLYGAADQINFQIPAAFPAGPATLMVSNGAVNAYPIYVQIDSAPAVINVPAPETGGTPITGMAGVSLQATNPGDIVNLQVTNVDPSIVNAPGRVQVTLSGVPMTLLSVTAVSATVFQIQFAVTQSFAGWQVPLVVSVDGSPSLAIQVTAR